MADPETSPTTTAPPASPPAEPPTPTPAREPVDRPAQAPQVKVEPPPVPEFKPLFPYSPLGERAGKLEFHLESMLGRKVK